MESTVTKFADFIGKSTDISIPNAAYYYSIRFSEDPLNITVTNGSI